MRKTRFSSIAVLSALFLIVGVMAAAPAFAATSCTIDPNDLETMTVNVDSGANVQIVRADTTVEATDDKILVNIVGGAQDLCAGQGDGFYTVFDIDTINVTGGGAVTIDLSGGEFAPGFNTETGTDEIEFYFGTGLDLTIQGTSGVDDWTFTTAGVGLNSDSDADIMGAPSSAPTSLTLDSLTANGLAGNDTFEQTSRAAEVLNGGLGTDTVDYGSRTEALMITVGDAVANDGETSTGGEKDNVGADIEIVIGGSGADNISVPTTSTSKYKLDGGAGADVLSGGAGRDTLLGGAGADTLNGGDARDLLNGGADNDTENGQGGSDVFDQDRATNGGDTLNGGEDGPEHKDVDMVTYKLRTTSVRVSLGDNVADGACSSPCTAAATEGDNVGDDVERVYGGQSDDVLTAKDGAGYKLYGGSGNDTLTGANKDDRLVAGAGNDKAFGGAGDDYLSGSAGNDRLFGEDGEDNLVGGADDDTMNGQADSDRVSGGSGEDSLWGDGAAAKVKDTLVGGSQPSGKKDKCERDLKDVKSGCEGRTSGTAPTS